MITTKALVTVEGIAPYTVENIIIYDADDPACVEETRTIIRTAVENVFDRPANVQFAFEQAKA